MKICPLTFCLKKNLDLNYDPDHHQNVMTSKLGNDTPLGPGAQRH